MDPGRMSADHYAFYVNGFPYTNVFPPTSAGVAPGQAPVTPHHNVARNYPVPEMHRGEHVRRPADSQTKETSENKEHPTFVHRQAMMNAFPAVATYGGNRSLAVAPRQLAPPSYASVQPSENEQLKRQIEERMKELAQKNEELKAAAKRATLTDGKATSAVVSAKEKNQQLKEDAERANEQAETLKKELDDKDALIDELRKENDEILGHTQEILEPSTDVPEDAQETVDEPHNNGTTFMHDSELRTFENPTVAPSEANDAPYQPPSAAQPTYLPYNYTKYWPYPMTPQ